MTWLPLLLIALCGNAAGEDIYVGCGEGTYSLSDIDNENNHYSVRSHPEILDQGYRRDYTCEAKFEVIWYTLQGKSSKVP